MVRVQFLPNNDAVWLTYFSNQAKQVGGSYYQGHNYQRGAGLGTIFSSLMRYALPFLKSAGKAVAKQGLQTGIDLAGDVLAGQNIKAATKRRVRTGARKLYKKAVNKLNQTGTGTRRRKRKRTVTRKRGRKTIKRRKVSRIKRIHTLLD